MNISATRMLAGLLAAFALLLLGACASMGDRRADAPATAADPATAPAPAPAAPDYPPNDGFLGEKTAMMLQPGAEIDRFGGHAASRFFAPVGTPLPARALPPGVDKQPLRTFRVLKAFAVEAGTIAPWYGQPGMGIQYRSTIPLGELLSGGYLVETTETR